MISARRRVFSAKFSDFLGSKTNARDATERNSAPCSDFHLISSTKFDMENIFSAHIRPQNFSMKSMNEIFDLRMLYTLYMLCVLFIVPLVAFWAQEKVNSAVKKCPIRDAMQGFP